METSLATIMSRPLTKSFLLPEASRSLVSAAKPMTILFPLSGERDFRMSFVRTNSRIDFSAILCSFCFRVLAGLKSLTAAVMIRTSQDLNSFFRAWYMSSAETTGINLQPLGGLKLTGPLTRTHS